MDKKLLVVGIGLLMLAACDPNIVTPNYYEGSEGLVLEFVGNTPPDEVYEGDTFNVILSIHNAGAFDLVRTGNIENMTAGFLFYNFDSLYVTDLGSGLWNDQDVRNIPLLGVTRGEKAKVSIPLEAHGKSGEYPLGEYIFLPGDFLFQANTLVGERESAETTLYFTACYPYRTTLSKEICIDKDVYAVDQADQVCKSENLQLIDQGAPIAITKIEPSMVARQDRLPDGKITYYVSPSFRITLENKAGGNMMSRFTDKTAWEQCVEDKDDATNWNRALVTATLSNKALVCSPGFVKFTDGKAIVTCRVNPGDALSAPHGNYFTNLQVNVDYIYMDTLSKQITVQRKI